MIFNELNHNLREDRAAFRCFKGAKALRDIIQLAKTVSMNIDYTLFYKIFILLYNAYLLFTCIYEQNKI
jgi:hypothetical protein